MRIICSVLILFFLLNNNLTAQKNKFSFLVEGGLNFSQIDGDKLMGYHKKRPYLSIGSNYSLSHEIKWGVELMYSNIGSRRKNKFQDKLADGSQLEVDLKTVGMGSYLLYKPEGYSIFVLAGLDFRQIMSSNTLIVDNIVNMPDRAFPEEGYISRYANYKIGVGWAVNYDYRFSFVFERAFNNLLKEPFLNIDLILPYGITAKFTYEFNSVFRSKSKRKKIRKRN